MADLDDKLPDNVAGKWYVDSNCIDCDVCRTTAPNNFEANEDEKALTEAEAFLNDLDKENFDFHDLVHRGRGILHGMMQHFNKSH